MLVSAMFPSFWDWGLVQPTAFPPRPLLPSSTLQEERPPSRRSAQPPESLEASPGLNCGQNPADGEGWGSQVQETPGQSVPTRMSSSL